MGIHLLKTRLSFLWDFSSQHFVTSTSLASCRCSGSCPVAPVVASSSSSCCRSSPVAPMLAPVNRPLQWLLSIVYSLQWLLSIVSSSGSCQSSPVAPVVAPVDRSSPVAPVVAPVDCLHQWLLSLACLQWLLSIARLQWLQ